MKTQKPRGWDEMTKSEEKIADLRSSGNAASVTWKLRMLTFRLRSSGLQALKKSNSDSASHRLSCLVLLLVLRKRLLGLDPCSLTPELPMCYSPHFEKSIPFKSTSRDFPISSTLHLLNSPSLQLPICWTPHDLNCTSREHRNPWSHVLCTV